MPQCPSCAEPAVAGLAFCLRCGSALSTSAEGVALETDPTENYAGFGRRFSALMIDGALVGAFRLMGALIAGSLTHNAGGTPLDIQTAVTASTVFVAWLYEAWLTSSPARATFGKQAVGIVVTDLEGGRIGLLRASVRHFAKLVSAAALMLGFLIQPLTARKQALHDLLAGTIVTLR